MNPGICNLYRTIQSFRTACSQRIYSNYERGDVDIPTAVLIRLADFYDVSVDYLLNRTDKPKTNR